MKTLRDISWQVTEPEYRADPALSYSTLSRFAREGFDNLDTLFDKIDTPSLTFGSAVDALITGGQEEFDKNFLVAEFPPVTEAVGKMVKAVFDECWQAYTNLGSVPDSVIIDHSERLKYQLNWKPETRAKVIKEQGSELYNLLYIAGDRKVVSTSFKDEVDNCVTALKTSPATAFYFNESDTKMERYYQLKFKATLEGVDYRCMADLILVDHVNKKIYPVDLKTSGHPEWDFYDSFITWRYDIQARLYWRIIRHNLDKDEFYKDYTLSDYRFIVVNKRTVTPLVWIFYATQLNGTLIYGKDKQIELQDPFELGKELSFYLSSRPSVPTGIEPSGENDIIEWLNKKK